MLRSFIIFFFRIFTAYVLILFMRFSDTGNVIFSRSEIRKITETNERVHKQSCDNVYVFLRYTIAYRIKRCSRLHTNSVAFERVLLLLFFVVYPRPTPIRAVLRSAYGGEPCCPRRWRPEKNRARQLTYPSNKILYFTAARPFVCARADGRACTYRLPTLGHNVTRIRTPVYATHYKAARSVLRGS
jgi:hypothetical protein